MFPVKIEIYSAQAKKTGKRLVFMRIIAFSGTSGQFCQRSYIGFTVNTFPLEVKDSYAKGVVISTSDFPTFWGRTAPMSMINQTVYPGRQFQRLRIK